MDSKNEIDIAALKKTWPLRDKSWVWSHCCLDATVEARDRAVCLHCGAIITYQNTSNMAKHLESVHKLRDISSYQQERARGSSGSQPTLSFHSQIMNAATKSFIDLQLTKFLASDGRPVSLIAGQGFRSFVKVRPATYLYFY